MITDNVIDVRDIIDEYKNVDGKELQYLATILDQLRSNGGDVEWCGDWFPVLLIREDYFQTYAEEFAEEIDAISSEASWPNNCIDWRIAAFELRKDYSPIVIDNEIYWYR